MSGHKGKSKSVVRKNQKRPEDEEDLTPASAAKALDTEEEVECPTCRLKYSSVEPRCPVCPDQRRRHGSPSPRRSASPPPQRRRGEKSSASPARHEDRRSKENRSRDRTRSPSRDRKNGKAPSSRSRSPAKEEEKQEPLADYGAMIRKLDQERAVEPKRDSKGTLYLDPYVDMPTPYSSFDTILANIDDYVVVPYQPNVGSDENCKKMRLVFIRKSEFDKGAMPDGFGLETIFAYAPASDSVKAWHFGAWKVPNPDYVKLSAEERKRTSVPSHIDGPDLISVNGKTPHQREPNDPTKARYKFSQTSRWPDEVSVCNPDGSLFCKLDLERMPIRANANKVLVAQLEKKYRLAAISYSMLWCLFRKKVLPAWKALPTEEMEKNIRRDGVPCRFPDEAYDMKLPGVVDIRPRLQNTRQAGSSKAVFGDARSVNRYSKSEYKNKMAASGQGNGYFGGRGGASKIKTRRVTPDEQQWFCDWIVVNVDADIAKTAKNWKQWHAAIMDQLFVAKKGDLPAFRTQLTEQFEEDAQENVQTLGFKAAFAKNESKYGAEQQKIHKCGQHSFEFPNPICLACDNWTTIYKNPFLAHLYNTSFSRVFPVPEFNIWHVHSKQNQTVDWQPDATSPVQKLPAYSVPMDWKSRGLLPGEVWAPVVRIKGTCHEGGAIGDFLNLKLEIVAVYWASERGTAARAGNKIALSIAPHLQKLLPSVKGELQTATDESTRQFRRDILSISGGYDLRGLVPSAPASSKAPPLPRPSQPALLPPSDETTRPPRVDDPDDDPSFS